MRDIVNEVVAGGACQGRAPARHDRRSAVFKLADVMPQTMSSTAQDLAKGKRTEIDHLNGYVVSARARRSASPTPVNRMLNALMKLLEQTKTGPRGGR